MIDAHTHLQRFLPRPDHAAIFDEMSRVGVTRAMVNGTSEQDWDSVAELATQYAWMQPSFGIHPWYASHRSSGWATRLRELLHRFPSAGVGEIGLDRWIHNADLRDQAILFTEQMNLAAEFGRAVTIHCVRAWGALVAQLAKLPLPCQGFLIHAYGGPPEMLPKFLQLGARISWNGYFLDERKTAKRETFLRVPLDRLLIETDAPDLLLPENLDHYNLRDSTAERINHPAGLKTSLKALAGMLQMDVQELESQTNRNYHEVFG